MNGKKIVLYVTGSIAAYKAVYLMRILQKNGAEVRVVMTPFATKFVSKATFQTLSKHKVYDDESYFIEARVTHIELAQWADISIVAPATADFIAKAANGIADNFAQTTFLATPSLKIVVPTMNDIMLKNDATKKNIATLQKNGVDVIDSDVGMLAEGYSAKGRMPDPENIVEHVIAKMSDENKLKDLNFLVTAGGTREQIDPVRFISNRSSGKMGYAIAKAARDQGANVTLISANSSLPDPVGMKIIKVNSVDELQKEILTEFKKNNVLVMAAAVSDFKPKKIAKQKIKKLDDENSISLVLEKTTDILKEISKLKTNGQYVVGFAAETQSPEKNARIKLKKKNLDLIVLNDVSNPKIGFNSDLNQVTFITNNGIKKTTAVETKDKIATELIDIIVTNFKD